MNKLEKEKVEALALLRIPDIGYGAVLIKNLCWRQDHEPNAPLSRKEKYLLELCCWHYRKALGGTVAFDLPSRKPEKADYLPMRLQPQSRLL